MKISFKTAVSHIIKAGNRLDRMNLAPATSGNYSMRTGENEMAITVSGAHKGQLKAENIMRADLNGAPLENKKPSAETLLHCQLYKLYPHVNAILHTHSVPSTVLSRLYADASNLTLSGYEMLKAFPGVTTHDTTISLPIFNNTQDMDQLSADVDAVLHNNPDSCAYIIRNHGIYGWGKDMAEAERVIEATEMLLSCEMHLKQLTT